jgi:hypothetical protein
MFSLCGPADARLRTGVVGSPAGPSPFGWNKGELAADALHRLLDSDAGVPKCEPSVDSGTQVASSQRMPTTGHFLSRRSGCRASTS